MTAAPTPRIRVPVPPWGRALIAVVLVLEASGWATRVGHAPRWISHPLSMELPWSLPRMTVAAVFLVAAAAACVGVVRFPHRRAWWSTIAVVAALIAVVKGGGTVHRAALEAIDGYAHPVRALVVFGTTSVVGLCWLYWLSRDERRDRRRVLAWAALYASAAVGLSTISGAAESVLGHGSALVATAALAEEAAEGVAAVGFLLAVLLGVAPTLVLPADWRFRRPEDMESPTVSDLGLLGLSAVRPDPPGVR